MLVSFNEKGERIYAEEAIKKDSFGNTIKYYCPECGSELVLKQGTKNIWHFAHKDSNTICHFRKGGGETIVHQNMKYTIKKIIEKDNNCLFSELEWKIGSKIADYYFEVKDKWGNIKKVAVECVHRNTNIDIFRNKTQYYSDRGIFVLWVFNIARFLNKDNSFKDEVRINEIIRECHTMYFGKCFAVDISNSVVYALHLDSVVRYVHEQTFINWDEWDGHSNPEETCGCYTVGGYPKYLKSTKTINPKIIFEFIINTFTKKKKDYYLNYNRNIACNYIESWW